MNSKQIFFVSLLITGILMLVVWASIRISSDVAFDRHCGGYLSRASYANSVELATEAMGKALTYLERNQLTEGYTSVFYRTPDEDIGFWYDNLKASQAELKSIRPEATPLERSNVLMKLRETLKGNGESGDYLIVPDGISVYPANGVLLFVVLAALGVMMFGIIGFFWFAD